MKRTIAIRCLIGAPVGLAISTAVCLIISLAIGDGTFHFVSPDLIKACGSELNAALLQALFSLLYGAAWGGASAVWEVEHWSLLRQTITHLVICSVFTFPIAWWMNWMPHHPLGITAYFGIFLAVYAVIWLILTMSMRRQVRRMNQQLDRFSS